MLYAINSEILMKKGFLNGTIYIPNHKKLLHVKNVLIDQIIEKKRIPENIKNYIGSEEYDISIINNNINIDIESIFIDLTSACNLKCIGCYSYKEKTGNISDEKLNFITKINNTENTKLVFLGGEPLLYPINKIKTHLDSWNGKFKKIIIFTNGYYLNNEWLDLINEHNISLRFTFYSFNEKIHNKYTKNEESFIKVLDAIKLCKQRNIKFKTNFILNSNEFAIKEKLLKSFKIDLENVFFDLVRPIEEHRNKEYFFEKEKHKKTKRPIIYKSFINAVRDNFYQSCYAGKFSVSVNGSVFCCPWKKNDNTINIHDANVIEKLSHKWKEPLSKTFSYCKVCEFSHLCFNCPSLNNRAIDIHRPNNCKYNPFIGEMEND